MNNTIIKIFVLTTNCPFNPTHSQKNHNRRHTIIANILKHVQYLTKKQKIEHGVTRTTLRLLGVKILARLVLEGTC